MQVMCTQVQSTGTKLIINDKEVQLSRSYLISGLDCWTGLTDWIVEWQNIELILVYSHN